VCPVERVLGGGQQIGVCTLWSHGYHHMKLLMLRMIMIMIIIMMMRMMMIHMLHHPRTSSNRRAPAMCAPSSASSGRVTRSALAGEAVSDSRGDDNSRRCTGGISVDQENARMQEEPLCTGGGETGVSVTGCETGDAADRDGGGGGQRHQGGRQQAPLHTGRGEGGVSVDQENTRGAASQHRGRKGDEGHGM
jgi:hypothetical protein